MPNINKNIIMQAGAAVANATNKAAGLSAATPEPGSIISAIQLVNGGRTIGPDALAHFTESVRNKLLSLLVNMEPIQDFNGYGHPWPGGGGINKLPNNATNETKSANGVQIKAENGVYTITGTPTAEDSITFDLVDSVDLSPSTNKIAFLNNVSNVYISVYFCRSGTPVHYWAMNEVNRVASGWMDSGNEVVNQIRITFGASAGSDLNITVSPMLIATSETNPTSFSPYSNICPISGKTGATAYVSPTPNVADATSHTADWTTPAGTVYAGSADIVTGDIKAAPYYASYNGETLVGPWVSSMDVYDPEGTPTTGAQVVDLGGTMTEYHITGQDIITLVGDNYIWSDGGDVTITE